MHKVELTKQLLQQLTIAFGEFSGSNNTLNELEEIAESIGPNVEIAEPHSISAPPWYRGLYFRDPQKNTFAVIVLFPFMHGQNENGKTMFTRPIEVLSALPTDDETPARVVNTLIIKFLEWQIEQLKPHSLVP